MVFIALNLLKRESVKQYKVYNLTMIYLREDVHKTNGPLAGVGGGRGGAFL